MVKRRSLFALGLLMSLTISARGIGQQPGELPNLPSPFTLEVPAVNDSHSSTAPANESETHVKLKRLWQFITFRQPPRPRECHECFPAPSSRCTPPLYEYFSNRYPFPNQHE
jgi:hypothetical protein